ncbi:hypothetical protein C5167_043655 [Papaver somniferum]|uniref:Uncharacterized protein n=1 Tax=Papaver somniferum TaxID=3469 RepID=A0A4Y7L7B3_PAPSO|nr:hypothetical protein C5167_043655 [Papaver somniferum]
MNRGGIFKNLPRLLEFFKDPSFAKCPVAVSFGFGGEIVSCKHSQLATDPPTGSSEVYMHTDFSLVSQSTEYEATIQGRKMILSFLFFGIIWKGLNFQQRLCNCLCLPQFSSNYS